MTEAAEATADTRTRVEYPRTAGRVDSGPGAPYVHLAFLVLGEDGWATACPADAGGVAPDAVGDPWGRQVRPALARIDCGACIVDARDLVDEVNRAVAEAIAAEEGARAVLARFFDWAATEYPEGGAVLAVYAGDTRLHPTRLDERRRVVDAYLAAERRFPVVE